MIKPLISLLVHGDPHIISRLSNPSAAGRSCPASCGRLPGWCTTCLPTGNLKPAWPLRRICKVDPSFEGIDHKKQTFCEEQNIAKR